MRIVIAAAGPQHKWGNYLGVPSHLVPIGGVPLLHRTVVQALGVTDDVHVTYPPGDTRYVMAADTPAGVVRLHPRVTSLPSEYRATRSLWSENDRTVLLLGDVYYTNHAIDTIAAYTERRYRGFGRRNRSRITGCRYGELFAASWWPEHHTTMDTHLKTIEAHHADGTITRPTGWMLLRAWQGTHLARHMVLPAWMTRIDDETEDWDFPHDYDTHPAVKRMRAGQQ